MKHPFERPLAVFVLLIASVFQQVQAETQGLTSIIVPSQTVEVLLDNNPGKAKFRAKLSILPDGSALGKARLRINGDVLVLHATEGRNFYNEDGERTHTELTFKRRNGGPVIATVTPLSGDPVGCDIWELVSSFSGGAASVIFEADGDITSVLIGR